MQKWNTNIEKMEYNFGTQLDHGEDKENKNAENTKVKI